MGCRYLSIITGQTYKKYKLFLSAYYIHFIYVIRWLQLTNKEIKKNEFTKNVLPLIIRIKKYNIE